MFFFFPALLFVINIESSMGCVYILQVAYYISWNGNVKCKMLDMPIQCQFLIVCSGFVFFLTNFKMPKVDIYIGIYWKQKDYTRVDRYSNKPRQMHAHFTIKWWIDDVFMLYHFYVFSMFMATFDLSKDFIFEWCDCFSTVKWNIKIS